MSILCERLIYVQHAVERELKVPKTQDHHISSPSLTIKQEFSKEDPSSDVTDHKLDPILWSDLKDFQPSKPAIMPLKMESDNNADNVYSCTDSQRLGMNFVAASVYFGPDFHFDETQLL
ncbi:hypothetical protein E2542_SST20822 [Spatholobus suberectus]|nr:hypothetical protein E2542_SST20822 [Spatholobus suberectus]